MSPSEPCTVITGAEVDGAVVDVAVRGGRVEAVGTDLPSAGARVVRAGGGALLPGLHDHHLHLLAMAAADASVRLDAVEATGPALADAALAAAHRATRPEGWLRAVGYDEHRHGPLDRQRLDALAPGRPVRVQHRSGAAWVLSTPALRAVGLDATGSGWVHRGDGDLATRWPAVAEPDLAAVGRRLASWGVTGVTDATPFADHRGPALLAASRASGALPQRVVVTGGPLLAVAAPPAGLELGPVKVVVPDHELPSLAELVAAFGAARRAGRPVAVHCVTRVALVLALAAWEEVGAVDGDRIEHGSVIPLELVPRLLDAGLRVVTQPGFVAERGDRYLDEVEADDVPHLYRCGSLLAAGVPVAGSTDAPFGPEDPWLAVAAAMDRRTASGRVVGPDEGLPPRAALGLFLGDARDPGGPARRIGPSEPADLCLLDRGLDAALDAPSASHVAACWIDGTLVAGDP